MVLKITEFDYGPERLIIRIEPDGPVDLDELGQSFSSFARMFHRQQELLAGQSAAVNTRLFVAKIENGGIIAEIVPLLLMLNEPIAFMAATNTIEKFSTNLVALLKKISKDESASDDEKKVIINSDDIRDLQAALKPLTGKKAAELGLYHVKIARKKGDHEIVAEYTMRAPEINMASTNMMRVQEQEIAMLAAPSRHVPMQEVLMRLFQASTAAGKEKGRTGDRAIIADVTERDLPLYFPKQSNDYKEAITKGSDNPFAKGYIVDVSVEYEGDTPRMYRLLHLHEVLDL